MLVSPVRCGTRAFRRQSVLKHPSTPWTPDLAFLNRVRRFEYYRGYLCNCPRGRSVSGRLTPTRWKRTREAKPERSSRCPRRLPTLTSGPTSSIDSNVGALSSAQ